MGNIGVFIPILALLIPIVAIVMVNWRKVQLKRMELDEQGLGQMSAASAERIRALEERVAVLEKLATDPANRLAHEINRLKDDRDEHR
ncbi:MAG: hypothetical protein ACK4MX_07425 [Thermaurantiacus sp.]